MLRLPEKKNDTSIREMNAMQGDMRISGGVSKILKKKVLSVRMWSVCFEIWVSECWRQSFQLAPTEALQRSLLRGPLTMTMGWDRFQGISY